MQSSNFSAEYGQVMGAFYNFTTKSGTNQFHGSAYEEWANEVMDARASLQSPHRQGPQERLWLHHRRSGAGFPNCTTASNHTFFFFNLERFGNNQASNAQTGTVPTAAYRQGDFSCALYATSTNCTGPMVTLTDPTSGYQFLQNQIFDPNSTYTDANGRLMRTPFPEQRHSAEPPGPGRTQDPVADTCAAECPDHAELDSEHRHQHAAADSEPEDRPGFRTEYEGELLLDPAEHQSGRRSRRIADSAHLFATQDRRRQSVPLQPRSHHLDQHGGALRCGLLSLPQSRIARLPAC